MGALAAGFVDVDNSEAARASTKESQPPGGRVPFVQAKDGTRLHVRDWGAGRPVVFVAPWALNSDWWDRNMTSLVDHGFRCVAYDRRGHGRSEETGRGYDFDTLADDLSAVLDRLDLRNVLLVGHSMGASEVVRYLTRHRSARATRALLVAPITPVTLKTESNPDGVPREILEQGRDALRKNVHQRIAEAAPGFFGAPKNNVSSQAMDWWTRMMVDRCSLKVMLDLHKLMTEADFRAELRTLTLPTLIVHGDSDTSAKLELTGRRTQQLIPNSELTVYAGAAHGLPFTHTEQLQADLLAFAR
jgi:pimeloyl-ACP methyl ester carboxylesterase